MHSPLLLTKLLLHSVNADLNAQHSCMLQVVRQKAMVHLRWSRIGREASTSLEVQSQLSTAQCPALGFQAERTLLEETLTRHGHAQAPPVVILTK